MDPRPGVTQVLPLPDAQGWVKLLLGISPKVFCDRKENNQELKVFSTSVPRKGSFFKLGIKAFAISTILNRAHLITLARNRWVRRWCRDRKTLGKRDLHGGKKKPWNIFYTYIYIYKENIYLFCFSSHSPCKAKGGNWEYLRELIRKAPGRSLSKASRTRIGFLKATKKTNRPQNICDRVVSGGAFHCTSSCFHWKQENAEIVHICCIYTHIWCVYTW